MKLAQVQQQQMQFAQKLRVATMKRAAQTLKGDDDERKILGRQKMGLVHTPRASGLNVFFAGAKKHVHRLTQLHPYHTGAKMIITTATTTPRVTTANGTGVNWAG